MSVFPAEFTIKLSMASIQGRPMSATLARFDDPFTALIGCSQGFLDLCGYAREDVIGRNCRFLNQRSKLPPRLRERMRQSIRSGVPFMGVVTNSRYLGSGVYESFENLLHLVLIVAGSRSYILGIQADVTGLDLKLTDGSQDALRLKHVFDKILSAGVDSWIHIQEGAISTMPLYLRIRHSNQGMENDDEVEIQEGSEYDRRPQAEPDRTLILAPQFSPHGLQESGDVNWQFLLLGEQPSWPAPIPGMQDLAQDAGTGIQMQVPGMSMAGFANSTLVQNPGTPTHAPPMLPPGVFNGPQHMTNPLSTEPPSPLATSPLATSPMTRGQNSPMAVHNGHGGPLDLRVPVSPDGFNTSSHGMGGAAYAAPMQGDAAYIPGYDANGRQGLQLTSCNAPALDAAYVMADDLRPGLSTPSNGFAAAYVDMASPYPQVQSIPSTPASQAVPASPTSPSAVPVTTMKYRLQELNMEDPRKVLVARGIGKLGFSSGEILRDYFTRCYGPVKTVHVPDVYKKRKGARDGPDNDNREKRVPGRGFIVMANHEDAGRILANGPDHLVGDVRVTLQEFSVKDCGGE